MKMYTILLASAIGIAGASSPVAAQPSSWVDVGTMGFTIRASQSERAVYTCEYRVSVTFPDGTSTIVSGQADISGGGQDMSVASRNMGRAISGANLTNWDCRFKRAW
jgi:hypothetical protein